jgi:tetratricopeptide (TPR) repeat protein
MERAARTYREVLQRENRHVGARLGLGAALLAQGKGDEAMQSFRQAIQLDPGNVEVHMRCATLLLEMNRSNHALEIFERVVAEHPDNPAAHDGVFRTYLKLGRGADAAASCRKAIARFPSSEALHCNLALALVQTGALEEAIESCQAAIRLNEQSARAYNCLGLVQMSKGDAGAASKSFEQSAALDPGNTAPYLNIAHARRFGETDRAEIDRVEALLDQHRSAGLDCADLHFALGKMHDDCGSYDKAFEHFSVANRSVARHVRFQGEKFKAWCSRLHKVFTPEFFRDHGDAGNASQRPIFIVGMPRSGTTLVEQILASHPDVHGAGELMKINEIVDNMEAKHGSPGSYPECIRDFDSGALSSFSQQYLDHIASLNSDAAHVTDKLPENMFHLGFIATLLPNARIIYCRRDPMDVCLSNFTQRFFQGHNYSYCLDDIATYYHEHDRIMSHWLEVLPIEIFEIDYETLVGDQETISKRLVSHCRLPWNDRCLAFHETKRAVNTASDWQVRRPIYRNSVRRWKNYAPYLAGLEERLKELGSL